MTLRRQLLLIILLLFLLMFAGASIISVNNTRHYLVDQMGSSAQDTATSLGLALSPHMKENDLETMNSMVDAIFDRGYYREIIVKSTDGKLMIQRISQVKVEGVPQWFVNLIPLNTPRAKALIMSGSRQTAVVYVSNRPGFAYEQLWRNSIGELTWFSLVGSGALILGLIVLHFMLDSLRAVEEQANAISNREYPVQQKLPWTTDLRRVVEVMNRMSIRVKQMFQEQAALTEKLRAETYMDAVTGLGNRNYFNTQVDYLIHEPEKFYSGTLFLLLLDRFKEYNNLHGFEAGDEILVKTADMLREIERDAPGCVLARMSGASFALFMPNVDLEASEGMAQRLVDAQHRITGVSTFDIGHVGVALYRKGMNVGKLLAEADMALRSAQSRGEAGWHRRDDAIARMPLLHGANNWRNHFKKVLEEKSILLEFQTAISASTRELLHREVLLRIPGGEGELLNAGIFMPMAENLGFSAQFDRLIVVELSKLISTSKDKFAVNLSMHSIRDQSFVATLEAILRALGTRAQQLMFEFQEYDVVNHVEAVGDFITRLQSHGCEFGVDHCGRGFASFSYLRDLKIHYLKIDGSYIRDVDSNKGHQFLVQSIAKIAHELDICVIAEAVETIAERDMLMSLYVDGLKGYLIGKPEHLTAA